MSILETETHRSSKPMPSWSCGVCFDNYYTEELGSRHLGNTIVLLFVVNFFCSFFNLLSSSV